MGLVLDKAEQLKEEMAGVQIRVNERSIVASGLSQDVGRGVGEVAFPLVSKGPGKRGGMILEENRASGNNEISRGLFSKGPAGGLGKEAGDCVSTLFNNDLPGKVKDTTLREGSEIGDYPSPSVRIFKRAQIKGYKRRSVQNDKKEGMGILSTSDGKKVDGYRSLRRRPRKKRVNYVRGREWREFLFPRRGVRKEGSRLQLFSASGHVCF